MCTCSLMKFNCFLQWFVHDKSCQLFLALPSFDWSKSYHVIFHVDPRWISPCWQVDWIFNLSHSFTFDIHCLFTHYLLFCFTSHQNDQNHQKEQRDLSSILENLDDDVPLWEAIKSHTKVGHSWLIKWHFHSHRRY